MDSVIQLGNLTRRFGSQVAVDNVSYRVPPGVVFALLGENGAGKTTTIRTLLGLETPSGGGVTVLGQDSKRAGAEIRRRVGYVPEQPALYEWMTVEASTEISAHIASKWLFTCCFSTILNHSLALRACI